MRFVAVLMALALPVHAQEAIQFAGRRELVIPSTGEVRWASDGGTCLTAPAWKKVDDEFIRLQKIENEPQGNALNAFVAGTIIGSLLTGGLLVGWLVVTKNK